ncbi:hypothetical protein RJ641_010238 [Dillenia turbinata]|uniref:Uncharacterized protein n=1 Tax=Dillenia turbinata TaxID=194707 RepID=A0AAN8UVX1_9MAGN
MCQPGLRQPIQPSQTRMAYSERNQLPLHANVSNINQVSQSQSLFSLPSQYGLSENSTIPSLLGVINPKTLFELEASLQAELEPLQIHSASKEKCSEISLPHQQSEIKMGAVGTVPIPCNAPSTNAKGCGSLQSCILGIDQSKEVLLKNIESSQILLQHSNSVHEGAIAAKAIAKMGPEF